VEEPSLKEEEKEMEVAVVQAFSLEEEEMEVIEVQELFPEEGGKEAAEVRTGARMYVQLVLKQVVGLQPREETEGLQAPSLKEEERTEEVVVVGDEVQV
jgi:hypothetical protein